MSSDKPSRTIPVLRPFYALLGATDITVESLRELGSQGRDEVEGTQTPALSKFRRDVTDLARGFAAVPLVAAGQTHAKYLELADRGRQAASEVSPFARKARSEGEALADAEAAKARRQARRLVRQAEQTVTKGRTFAAGAATDATRAAESTLRTVRTEAEHVVEAVSHPTRLVSGAQRGRTRGTSVGRRAAVGDTAVSATNPSGGDDEQVRPADSRLSSSVEAGAATVTRRRPSTSPTAKTATARKSAAKKTAAAAPGETSPVAKKTTVKTAKKASATKTATRKAAAKKTTSPVTSDDAVPTPAEAFGDVPGEQPSMPEQPTS